MKITEWKDVEIDGYPKKNGRYLIKIDGIEALKNDHWNDSDYYDVKHGFMYDWYTIPRTKVTHWAKLPRGYKPPLEDILTVTVGKSQPDT